MAKNVITVSRKYGSRGRDMGVALSKLLGIEYYDKDLIKIASEETGVHESLFGQADEKIRGSFFIKKSGAYKGTVEPPTSGDYTSDKNIFNLQAEVIKRLAERESCIIIGRCASYILKDFDNVCHIFLYGSDDFCVKNIAERYALKEKDAQKLCEQVTRERSQYYKYYTGKELNDADNYDLCVDISRIGFENSAELIKSYLDIIGFKK